MASASSNSLYKRVIGVTHEYLGPAAERFVERQIANHLKKSPDTLSAKDLDRLIDWIRAAICMITDDSVIIDEYIEQLHTLARQGERHSP